MLFCEARARARRGEGGKYIPFDEQSLDQWDIRKIEEAEAVLRQASKMGVLGPFQLEAAIQSAMFFGAYRVTTIGMRYLICMRGCCPIVRRLER